MENQDHITIPNDSILQRLKIETAPQHREVELRFNIIDQQLSLEQYIHWLGRLYGYYEPFEQMIEPWSSEVAVDWPCRRKSPLLVRDLSALGVTKETIASLPICNSFPTLECIGNVFGALYVFEGATLGGRIIFNHLENVLNLKVDNGASFFLPYGVNPRPQWLAFQSRVCEVAALEFQANEIIIAARETFDSFNLWLTG